MGVGEAGGRSWAGALATALIALACALITPAVAGAETYEVNSVADDGDALLGDFTCLTAAGKCTLRAAVEEANSSLGEGDRVEFDEVLFDGNVSGTIALTKSLPTIVDRLEILGECVPTGGVLGPCVGVDGPGLSEPALTIENSEEVEIDGLAVTGAETGIEVIGSPRFKALYDWLGVKLDGSAGGNGTGILVGPGSDLAKIGNGGFINVFAHNAVVGLDIIGASNTKVLGNYFGVGPDGTGPAANGEDIEVTAKSPGGPEAIGTAIGAQLTSQQAATPACDGACNVISGSGSSGIDLAGDGGAEAPATITTIVGNYIGLDANGAAAVPNVGDGVRVGQAARTVIGGPRVSEANRFAGGDSAVLAGPAAANLVVRGNSIGVDAVGGQNLAAPDDGILVNSEGLSGAVEEAEITGNELRMQGGTGIDQRGLGAWIAGNVIVGAGVGISTSVREEHGNLIENNLIERSELNAILLENDLNEVLGNALVATGGAGIRIHGSPPFGVSGNRIGGDAEADENAIFDSGLAAIEIVDVQSSTNEVGRNWGAGNGGPFIDLVAFSPGSEPKGPNQGIKPPKLTEVSQAGASGSADPGARVRVFRKADPSLGELEAFLGEAIADEEGSWTVAYLAPVPAGTVVAASQTGEAGGTSELGLGMTPAEPPAVPSVVDTCPTAGAASCPLPKQGDVAAPETKILKHPQKRSEKTTARFKFAANESGTSFRCKLDKKPFEVCTSPKKYKHLKPGKHVFKVRAIDAAGNVEPKPARYQFTVLG